MRVFLTRRNITIIIAALLIAAVAIVAVNTSGTPGVVTTVAETLMRPLKNAVSTLARNFASIYGAMHKYDTLVAENAALQEQIASFKQDYRESTELAEENARLRELLNLSKRHATMTYDTASVIGSSGSNWSSSFTLNKGSVNSDIAIGDAVITEKGVLVGRVTMVDVTSSTAVSLIDTTFSAGALIGENGESGIATGDFELMRSGMLKLEYLPDDTAALAGDAVVTGGKNDILPEGLVIGTVRRVARNTTGVGMYAEIEPGADLTHLSNVFIITEFTTSS